MGRATIEREGETVSYAMPKSIGMVVGGIVMILFTTALALVLLRDNGRPGLWTWLFPTIVGLGLLPIILNAAFPQMVRVDREGITARSWFGRRRIEWSDADGIVSYTNGQDLFLRVTAGATRVLLSTRAYGWDADDLRHIARQIDATLDAHRPELERPGPLDRFPSWTSKESGLGRS